MLKNHDILNHLTSLPQKVLSLHGTENVTDFVLHDLCHKQCFDLEKAAYLVDNPDFDCFKGVAGFWAKEAFDNEVIWETPELFTQHMQKASFNQKVRNILRSSMRRAHTTDEKTTEIIADYLELENPQYCSWQMKHDNHGILIYEAPKNTTATSELLRNGACLLGFCPIY